MAREERIRYQYSTAFKMKVVQEVEEGRLTFEGARQLYGIGGGSTIQGWAKSLGKNELLSKVVRVEMANERDKMKEIEKRNRQLEKALADEKLKVMCLESLVDIADEKYGIDLKKKSGLEGFGKPK